jgi:nitroreductase
MDLIETLRSTGAVREFTADPVPDEVIARILDTARFAPNGGNRQGWRVVVVKSEDTRRRIRDLYLPGWYEYLAQTMAGMTPWAATNDPDAERAAIDAGAERIEREASAGPGGFAEHFDEVPVMLVLLAELSALATVDRDLDHYTLIGGASIYPFAWSILLAARAEGLGGVITTMPIRRDDEMRALLAVPEDVVVAAVLALGRPVHQTRRLRRDPVDSFTTVDRFDGPGFTVSA